MTARLGDCLPPDHLACVVVDSVALLDLSALYARMGRAAASRTRRRRRSPCSSTGTRPGCSARARARATYESAPFRYSAGNRRPDHDTSARFRATFLPALKGLFVQALLVAQEAGALTLGTIRLDGTTIHADASKSKAVSDKRQRERDASVRAEVDGLFALAERLDERERPAGLVVCAEVARREGHRAGRVWPRPRR